MIGKVTEMQPFPFSLHFSSFPSHRRRGRRWYGFERRTLLSVWPCNKVNVNGELLASNVDTVGSLTVNANWHIGSSNGNSRFFDGEIREVAIWDSALNAAQAAAVYAGTTPSADYTTVVTSYTYDALNRLTSLTDPVGNTTSYTYDYRGLVLTETNEKNATRYYTYDSVGRLTSEHWGNTTDYFMYTYDLVGNLLYATDGDHSYSYTYDALYRPIYTSFNFDSQSAVFSYTYDLAGRQTSSSLTLNGRSDRVNEVTYDYLGNATTIKQTGNITDEIFAEFDYNANGLLTSVRRYEKDDDTINEIANSLYEYNANNAVTSITHKNPNGTQIVQHSYTYDNSNNIVEYLNSIDGQTSYDYDYLGQLIGADYSNQNLDDETYTYDENGNRITANGDTYTTGDNNELTSDGIWSYTYDAEGNRVSKTNATNRELYTWDHRNRLTSVTQQEWDSGEQDWTTTQVVEYTYDYNNVWIRKIVGENKTIFISENYQTTVQIDNNAVTHHYLWTPNQQDKLLADTTSTEVLWSLTDHLGTIRDILGATATHLIYDAFGNLTSGTNPLLFGYTGKAFDSATNLQNNINRWYDATLGRGLSVDPIGFEGDDSNLYRYVKNNSFNRLDVWGLKDTYKKCDPVIRKEFIGYTIQAIGVVEIYDSRTPSIPQGSTNPGPISAGYSVRTIRCALCKEYTQIQTCRTYQKVYIYGFIPCTRVQIEVKDEILKDHFFEIIKTQDIKVGPNYILSGSISLISVPIPGAKVGPGLNMGTITGFMANDDLVRATRACKNMAKQLQAELRNLPKRK